MTPPARACLTCDALPQPARVPSAPQRFRATRLGLALLCALGASSCPAMRSGAPQVAPEGSHEGSPTLRLTRVEFLGQQAVAARLVAAAFDRIGRSVRISPMPAGRAQALTREGGSDGEVARIGAYFEGRPELVRVDPPLLETEAIVIVRKDNALNWAGAILRAEQLRGARVGVVRGVLLFERAVAGLPGVVRVSAPDQLYRMLDAGRLDVVVDTPINMRCMAKHLGRPGGFVQVGTLAHEPVFLGLQARHRALAPALSAALAQLLAGEEAEALRLEAEHDYLESECR